MVKLEDVKKDYLGGKKIEFPVDLKMGVDAFIECRGAKRHEVLKLAKNLSAEGQELELAEGALDAFAKLLPDIITNHNYSKVNKDGDEVKERTEAVASLISDRLDVTIYVFNEYIELLPLDDVTGMISAPRPSST